jgi:hypothetical protein
VSHVSPNADIAQRTYLGVQLYSVRDDLGPADLGRTLGRLAAMGFTHVEPYRLLDHPDQLAGVLESTGLAAVTAHANVLSADREALLAAAGRLGIGTVIVPWADPGRLHDRAAIEARLRIQPAGRRGTGLSGPGGRARRERAPGAGHALG